MNSEDYEAGNSTRVEAYLDQVLAPLLRQLSPFYQEELRRELRAHLWERVDAYQELGQSEDDAVTEALKQFGGAKDFARQWRQDWMQEPSRLTLCSIYEAGRVALLPLLSGLAAAEMTFCLLNGSLSDVYLRSGALVGTFGFLSNVYLRGGALVGYYGTELGWAFAGIAFLALPGLIGVSQGRRMPQRAGLGIFAALGAVVTAGSISYLLGTAVGLDQTTFGDALASLVMMAAAWTPIACTTAVLTGWGMRRSKLRRLV